MECKTANDECLPSWLDKTFIVNALKSDDPEVDASNAEVVLVEKLEGGYLSDTYRVVVRSQGDTREASATSLIVKAAPDAVGAIQDMIDSGVFNKEEVAYEHFLPAVNAALKEAQGSQWQTLGPKLYLQGSQPVSFFVMEDLEAAGFRRVMKGTSLNLQQCRAVMHNIARMHAASVKVHNDWQYASKVFKESLIFNDLLLEQQQEMDHHISRYLQILDHYSWFHKYSGKLQESVRNLCKKTVDLVQQSHVDFKVLVHGDLHQNNMMFRSDGDDVQVQLFDFQGLHVGSPAEDLLYFLHTSASPEVLQHHWELLLSEYHSTLQCTLRALGLQQQADAFPLHQLRREMEHFGLIAIFSVFVVLPAVLCTDKKDVPIDTTSGDYQEKLEIFRQKTSKNKEFLQHVEYLIHTFDPTGL